MQAAAVMNPGIAYPVFVAGIKYPSLFQAQAEAMYRAQEALKADYGLVGPDATLFNGFAAPMGSEALA